MRSKTKRPIKKAVKGVLLYWPFTQRNVLVDIQGFDNFEESEVRIF